MVHINGYYSHFNSNGAGKGLALFIKEEIPWSVTTDIKKEKLQITKIEFEPLPIAIGALWTYPISTWPFLCY